MKNKVSVGILVDDFMVPAWTYKVLEDILADSNFEVKVLIKRSLPPPAHRSIFQKISQKWRLIPKIILQKFLNTVVERLKDRRISVNAFEMKNIKSLVSGVEIIKVTPLMRGYSDFFPPDDVKYIKEKKLDVMLRFGFRILKGEILSAAECGVWSLHHGDNRVNRGGPAGFWEVFHEWPVTGTILQILNEDLDGGLVLSRSYSATNKETVLENKNNFYLNRIPLIKRSLDELHSLGNAGFLEAVKARNAVPEFYSAPLFRDPGFKDLVIHMAKRATTFAKRKWHEKRYLDQWILLFKLGNGLSTSLRAFKEIIPPSDRFWADPHVVFKDGRYFVFIEELLYSTGRGHISVLEIFPDGTYTTPRAVIQENTHLSYPFCFELNGEMYLMPENAENSALPLYRAVDFPLGWELVGDLSDGMKVVDATLIYQDGLWWMFANKCDVNGGSNLDELFLFYRDDLFSGRWSPHPKNPIVSDVRNARPAGRIFLHKGSLYRPAQDCSERYGYGININRIEEMTIVDYRETQVSDIKPNWSEAIIGTHSISAEHNLTVVDAIKIRKRY